MTKKKTMAPPPPPEKPMDPFFRFAEEERERLSREKPTTPMMEAMMLIGDAWKAMSAGDRAPYIRRWEDDQARYEAEMAAFEQKR
jgi:hypothetical protein